MFGQDLTLIKIKEFELWTHFASNEEKLVRIGEKFELSDRFCQGLIANAHWIKKFVRISESSNYRVFELTGVKVMVG